MIKISCLTLIILVVSCNQAEDTPVYTANVNQVDTISTTSDSVAIELAEVDTINSIDTDLIGLSNEILLVLQKKDFKKLSEYVHPSNGLKGYFAGNCGSILHDLKDPSDDENFDDSTTGIISKKDLQVNVSKKKFWGYEVLTDRPINLTIKEFFDMLYDADYIHAEKISVNKILGPDFTLDAIFESCAGCDVVEFYFPGSAKFEGRDMKDLILVFKRENQKIFLVEIIHNEWWT